MFTKYLQRRQETMSVHPTIIGQTKVYQPTIGKAQQLNREWGHWSSGYGISGIEFESQHCILHWHFSH